MPWPMLSFGSSSGVLSSYGQAAMTSVFAKPPILRYPALTAVSYKIIASADLEAVSDSATKLYHSLVKH